MGPVFVRTASRRDLDQVRALLVDTWHATYDAIYGEARVNEITNEWHTRAALEQRLDAPSSEFLLADDGKMIGGMAYATSVDDGKTVKLHQLYVRPGHQGQGIGGLLLDEVEGCFPDADRIRLEVEEANLQAVAFYLAQGFARTGQTANCGMTDSEIPAAIFERPIMWAD